MFVKLLVIVMTGVIIFTYFENVESLFINSHANSRIPINQIYCTIKNILFTF